MLELCDLPMGKELNTLVHQRVFRHLSNHIPHYSSDMNSAWILVDHFSKFSNSYDRVGYRIKWQGPIFKGQTSYLTNEGFPLGTVCWYVQAEAGGIRRFVCHESAPTLAICYAALWIIDEEEALERWRLTKDEPRWQQEYGYIPGRTWEQYKNREPVI